MAVNVLPQRPQFFAVQLELHAPAGETVNVAAKVKVAMDAVVLSLSCEDGSSSAAGIVSFAASVDQPEPAVRLLLMDRTRALFGTCRMVDGRGQANPPDSGCVQGSLVRRHSGGHDWKLSGRVVAVRGRES
jgi:hypothetical protein